MKLSLRTKTEWALVFPLKISQTQLWCRVLGSSTNLTFHLSGSRRKGSPSRGISHQIWTFPNLKVVTRWFSLELTWLTYCRIYLEVRHGRRKEPCLEMWAKSTAKQSMRTFSFQTKRSHCNIKLNDFGRSILMRPSRFSLSLPCLWKTKERWPSLKAVQSRKKATTKQHCYRNVN